MEAGDVVRVKGENLSLGRTVVHMWKTIQPGIKSHATLRAGTILFVLDVKPGFIEVANSEFRGWVYTDSVEQY